MSRFEKYEIDAYVGANGTLIREGDNKLHFVPGLRVFGPVVVPDPQPDPVPTPDPTPQPDPVPDPDPAPDPVPMPDPGPAPDDGTAFTVRAGGLQGWFPSRNAMPRAWWVVGGNGRQWTSGPNGVPLVGGSSSQRPVFLEFGRRYNVAIFTIATSHDNINKDGAAIDAVEAVCDEAGWPELAQRKGFISGFSAAGVNAWYQGLTNPDRFAGIIWHSGKPGEGTMPSLDFWSGYAHMADDFGEFERLLNVPVMFACGENDYKRYATLEWFFDHGRSLGAPWVWAEAGDEGHAAWTRSVQPAMFAWVASIIEGMGRVAINNDDFEIRSAASSEVARDNSWSIAAPHIAPLLEDAKDGERLADDGDIMPAVLDAFALNIPTPTEPDPHTQPPVIDPPVGDLPAVMAGITTFTAGGQVWAPRGVNMPDANLCDRGKHHVFGTRIAEQTRRMEELQRLGCRVLRYYLVYPESRLASGELKAELQHVCSKAAQLGMYVVLSVGRSSRMDSNWHPLAGLDELWVQMAGMVYGRTNVLFNIVNEVAHNTNGNLDEQIAAKLQRVTTRIRVDVDPDGKHCVVVPGTGQWSRRHDYYINNPITGGNIGYDVHVYDPNWLDYTSVLEGKLPFMVGEFGPSPSNGMTRAQGIGLMQRYNSRRTPWMAWVGHEKCHQGTGPANIWLSLGSNGGVNMPLRLTEWGQAVVNKF